MKILIIGKGWIGQRCYDYWNIHSEFQTYITDVHINSVDDVLGLIAYYNPDAILNAAGVVGKPNVDWCEKHQLETYYGNTYLPMLIADACQQQGVYLLHIGTGCVYYGYKDGGWRPEDYANPIATYTRSKYAADLMLSTLPNVGVARIRMPIDYIPFRANLVDKLSSFTKVVDVENSATVIEDMQDAFLGLIRSRAQGIFHVTNPGTITHKEILEWYNLYVDQNHINEWITVEGLLACGLSKKTRSNTILNSENLEDYGIYMRPIKIAVEDAIIRYAQIKKEIV